MADKIFTNLGISGTAHCESKDQFETMIKKLNSLTGKFEFFNYENDDWNVTFRMGTKVKTSSVGKLTEKVRKYLGVKDINVVCM